jgi:hypothetical protein
MRIFLRSLPAVITIVVPPWAAALLNCVDNSAGDLLIEAQQPDREGAGPEIGEALIGCRAVSETRRNSKLQIRVVADAVSDGSLRKASPIVHRAGTGNPSRVRSPGLIEWRDRPAVGFHFDGMHGRSAQCIDKMRWSLGGLIW